MNKTKKHFRKHVRYNKSHKKHKKHKKTGMRRNKKLNKSRKYKLHGGSYPYLPQDLVNIWWNTEHGLNKMINNWRGVPTGPGPSPTIQPALSKDNSYSPKVVNLPVISEAAALNVSNILQ